MEGEFIGCGRIAQEQIDLFSSSLCQVFLFALSANTSADCHTTLASCERNSTCLFTCIPSSYMGCLHRLVLQQKKNAASKLYKKKIIKITSSKM